MNLTNSQLRAIHAQACTAVLKVNRSLTPDVDMFWKHYLRAAIAASAELTPSNQKAPAPQRKGNQ